MGKVMGILSLKGGVGKTSVVSSLGDAISEFNKKVLLVDGNLSAPNLGFHFNLEPSSTLHSVLSGKSNPKDAVHKMKNLDIMPSDLFNKTKINPLKLRDKIKYLKRSYDFIILDSPPSLNEESLAVVNASDMIFLVTTPDISTMNTTLKTAKDLHQKGAPLTGLIINKVYGKDFELSTKDIEEIAGVPVMAVIPHDINILKSQAKFKPSTKHNPKSEASDEFKRLAAALLGEKFKPVRMKRMFRWINPKKQDINRTVFYESVFKSKE